ncbi:MAG TPA: hypothetical protein VF666_07275 [Pyrinomonadaceae bacterium]
MAFEGDRGRDRRRDERQSRRVARFVSNALTAIDGRAVGIRSVAAGE